MGGVRSNSWKEFDQIPGRSSNSWEEELIKFMGGVCSNSWEEFA